jgi:hypothetical protein
VKGKAGGKVMRENEPVLLVLSVCDGKIILEKGEILYEKCQIEQPLSKSETIGDSALYTFMEKEEQSRQLGKVGDETMFNALC